MESLRILIADDETLITMSLSTMLQNMGHQVVGRVRSGEDAVEAARKVSPDLILMDIRMGDMDGIEASRRILSERSVPIIILTAFSNGDLIERADAVGVSGYIVKPVTENDLLPAITIARSRFRQLKDLEREVGNLKEALRARKLIEQAKGILMEKEGITESEAYRRIQQQSRNQNIPMVKLAEAIIATDKLISGKRGGHGAG